MGRVHKIYHSHLGCYLSVMPRFELRSLIHLVSMRNRLRSTPDALTKIQCNANSGERGSSKSHREPGTGVTTISTSSPPPPPQ